MCSTVFRKLFRRGNSHSTDFHPDRPPPAFHALYLSSPTSNASSTLADAGWDFTDANPLSAPTHFTPSTLSQIHSGTLGFAPPPPRFLGTITSPSPGILNISSSPGCPDTCLISSLPLYAAGYDHPYNTGHSASAYFTVHITSMPSDSCLALGFCAVPYPGFRLPGWNRGSLGVHGDDGRRYVNDSFGGRDFVVPFKAGETVGVGMKWAREGVEVWFTRDGVREGGWRLDEQRDAREENDPAPGLDGGCDVYGAVGVWGGGVKAQVRFLKEGEEGKEATE
ncbi:hypothetical protein K440DRAFT_659812 [Wilcoxina mikolae CBS 423.85]|nr:hypothetical protein K440DRAFT_659812 [Wilcoxina mikolae CBS 423.85]